MLGRTGVFDPRPEFRALQEQAQQDELWDVDFYTTEPKVEMNSDLSNYIVLHGLPRTKGKKLEKLSKYLQGELSKHGVVTDFVHELDAKGNTPGFAYAAYQHPGMAALAISKMNNKSIGKDKSVIMKALTFPQFQQLLSYEETYTPLRADDYTIDEDLYGWMRDTRGRDQFVVRRGMNPPETEVFWVDALRGGAQMAYAGSDHKHDGRVWTSMHVKWSPHGTFFATQHDRGIMLWGGERFSEVRKFAHEGVQLLAFSPRENYLLTFDGLTPTGTLNLWDVRTGQLIAKFNTKHAIECGLDPMFKWSHDDKFFARLTPKGVAVYATDSLRMMHGASKLTALHELSDVKDFEWSPSDNVIAFSVPEHDQNPARVGIVAIPSGSIVREQPHFNVDGVRMKWHPQGDFLSVGVGRLTKNRKPKDSRIDIFRMRQRDTPMEFIETEYEVHALAFEPNGNKVAIAHGSLPGSRCNVTIYELKPTKMKKVVFLEGRYCNALYWSPAGQHLVLAGLGTMNGALEFVDTRKGGKTLAKIDHDNCNDIRWDPSGRFLLTATITRPDPERAAGHTGYRMWTFQGSRISDVRVPDMYQIVWRPRPPTLLSAEEEAALRKTLREKYKGFEQEDHAIKMEMSGDAERRRLEKVAAWKAFRARARKAYAAEREQRHELGLMSDNEADYIVKDEEVEELLDVQERVVPLEQLVM